MRERLEAGVSSRSVLEEMQLELTEFLEQRKTCLLY